MNVAFRFHKSCERSNAFLASILKSDHLFGADKNSSSHLMEAPNATVAAAENSVKKEEYSNSDDGVDDNSFDCDIEVEMINDDEEMAKIEYIALEQKPEIDEFFSVEKHVDDSNTSTKKPSSSVGGLVVLSPTKESTCAAIENVKKPKRQYRKKSKVEETILSCVICGNVYKYPQDLERHIKRHTNDKQYMCS